MLRMSFIQVDILLSNGVSTVFEPRDLEIDFQGKHFKILIFRKR